MATLASQPTKVHPLLPSFPFEFIENLNNGHKSPWMHKEFEQASGDSAPIISISHLPPLLCKPVQSKHGILQRSNKNKGQNFEKIVRSCISQAVGFSTRQFKAILTSFSDPSARKNSPFGYIRCYASRTFSNGAVNNSNGGEGSGGDGGSGGGKGSGSGSGSSGGGESVGGNAVMGANWWRWKCQKYVTSDRLVLVTAASQPHIYDHAKSSCLWMMEGIVQTAIGRAIIHLTEPAIQIMVQSLLLPFHLLAALFYFSSDEFGNQVMQFILAVFVAGSLILVLLVWLVWRLLKNGGSELDEDSDGNKEKN